MKITITPKKKITKVDEACDGPCDGQGVYPAKVDGEWDYVDCKDCNGTGVKLLDEDGEAAEAPEAGEPAGDPDEASEEINEFSGTGAIAGYALPLGMKPPVFKHKKINKPYKKIP